MRVKGMTKMKDKLRVNEAKKKKKVRKRNYVCYQEWKRSLMKIGGRMLSYEVFGVSNLHQ